MKIAVVGCGAMGSVYAALLHDAGHEVWAVDVWEDHVNAIKNKGLRLDGASGSRVARLYATCNFEDVGICDLVILATKVMHVEKAARASKVLISEKTDVISIQNGLGGPKTAENILGKNKVIVGVVGGFGSSIKEPGHAHHNGWELVRLGELSKPKTERLETVAAVWKSAGFRVECFDDIDQLVWEKLICNACFSATCAVTGLTIGEVMNDSDSWICASNCALEAYNVAIAKSIKLRIDDVVSYVWRFGSNIPNARPSMLLDHMSRRMSEIDAINGAITIEGSTVGQATPFNLAISSLIRNKERQMGVR